MHNLMSYRSLHDNAAQSRRTFPRPAQQDTHFDALHTHIRRLGSDRRRFQRATMPRAARPLAIR